MTEPLQPAAIGRRSSGERRRDQHDSGRPVDPVVPRMLLPASRAWGVRGRRQCRAAVRVARLLTVAV